MKHFLPVLYLLPLLIGCGKKEEPIRLVLLPDGLIPDSICYSRDIAPIFQSHCASCHIATVSGGVSFNGYDNAKANISAAIDAAENGRMPKTGAPLSGGEIAVLKAWRDNGTIQCP